MYGKESSGPTRYKLTSIRNRPLCLPAGRQACPKLRVGTDPRLYLTRVSGNGTNNTWMDIRPPCAAASLEQLPLNKIFTSPHQMRKHFDPAALKDLARSMKLEGLIQPI